MLYNENGDGMKKKRRLKKSAILLLIGIVLAIVAIWIGVSYFIKINSLPYKLGKLGYNDEDVKIITQVLTDENITSDILTKEYNSNLSSIINEKYFIYANLDRYLAYRELNNVTSTAVVTMVNAGRDQDYYANMSEVDTTKNELMLVNKYHYLSDTYVPDDLVDISTSYAYDNNQIRSIAYDDMKSMFNAAKEAGYILIVNSSYRSYEWQKTVYNSRKVQYGLNYADKYVARPGNSEHQTGLALDIVEYGSSAEFKDSEAYTWLSANAYKYGFIERYTADIEEVTGFSAEAWHYRYVGKEAAKEIHKRGISFEEYYAYYVDKVSE